MEIEGTKKQIEVVYSFAEVQILIWKQDCIFPELSCLPYLPCLPLRYEPSANTTLYDLKNRLNERMTKSLAGVRAADHMNYFLKLRIVWFMRPYKGLCLSSN